MDPAPQAPCPGCSARDETIAWLRGVVVELTEVVTRQEARIRALEARLRQNSTNSHRPPSTDRPTTPKVPRKPSGRKPGGQPGHPGRTRPLVPPDRVDETHDVVPEQCRQCGEPLSRQPGGDPIRRQNFEIPDVRPWVTEHRLFAACCARCGAVTRADLPAGVPRGAFGPRLVALVLVLRGAYRMSLRNVGQFLRDAFGVEVSLGSLKNVEDDVSEVLAPVVEELHDTLRESSEPVHADETSHREKGRRAYLWVAVAGFAAVFLIRTSRKAAVAKELLGEARRIVVTDRYSGYAWIPVWLRQVCLAHLRRDFRKMEDRGGEAGRIGAALGVALDEVFSLWHRVKAGTLAKSTFRRKLSPVRRRVESLLLDGTRVAGIAGTCQKILEVEPAMYAFARVDGVEPTNNRAEQAVRHAVIWRRTSFGTWSEAGSRYLERILTVVATLRIQKRNVLDYLTQVCTNALSGHAAPSLLPTDARDARLAA